MPSYTKNIRQVERSSVVGGRTGEVHLTASCTEPFNWRRFTLYKPIHDHHDENYCAYTWSMFVISHRSRPIYFRSFQCSLLTNHLAVARWPCLRWVLRAASTKRNWKRSLQNQSATTSTYWSRSVTSRHSVISSWRAPAKVRLIYDTAYHWVASETAPLYLIAFILPRDAAMLARSWES